MTLDSAAVTGLTDADVTCLYRKEGAGTFTSKTLDGSNFVEIGNGVYTVTFTEAELDTIGPFVIVITGADIDQSTTLIQVFAAEDDLTNVSLDTCVISGHVFDVAGKPVKNVAVSCKVLGLPSIEQSVAAVTNTLLSAKTAENGEFFIEVVRLADVEFYIPAVNYRRRLVVPNTASINLFDIA